LQVDKYVSINIYKS